ncbi:synaptic vesicle glycoprotein 2A-like isoform X2 [Schistocerca gregaria]|uniref:synaptic vesicle glycoprotein 2A-like isoform X2 n=1 Tax=Schistocerca gregaria TaxID=7010 RepID=UPI00211EC4CB|nr:synaptic vesicle glycoprotein 2A-like isoform X2 [Schistocerca gregaria]
MGAVGAAAAAGADAAGMKSGEDSFRTEMVLEANGAEGGGGVATPFEEAVAMTGSGKFHWVLLTVCGLCLVAMCFEVLGIAFVTPAVLCDFDMTSFEKGFLGGTIYIGMIVSSHLWGYAADTWGRHVVLSLTLGLDFVCSVLSGLMPSLPLLIVFRLLSGIWVCGPSAVTYAYLGEFHSDKTRAQSMVYVCLFIAAALVVQPGVAWAIIPQPWAAPLGWITLRSWRAFLVVSALPSAATFLGLWFLLPESPKFLLAAGRHDQALDVLRRMFSANTGLPPDQYPVVALQEDGLQTSPAGVKSPLAVVRHMWRQTAPLFRPPYLLYTAVACFIQFGLYASSNGFSMWLPELLNRVGQYNHAYPEHPTAVCDVIAILAGQMSPPVAVERFQANYSNTTAEYTTTEVTAFANWTTVDGFADSGANWTATALDSSTSGPEVCVATVSEVSFQNSMINGAGFAIAYVAIIPLVKAVSKRLLLALSLIASGLCGVAVLWAQTELQILMLPMAFVVLSGACVSVVNIVVVDAVPTYLRGMAVCLSLCFGRLGAFVTSLMLGALIDSSCVVAVSVLGGYVVLCGFLSLLLPSEEKMKKLRQ